MGETGVAEATGQTRETALERDQSSNKVKIFIGLVLGMFVAAASQTVVSPALPVIVSELGGVDHYSWVATSSLLVSAVTIPIVGKLSDIYGRREFFIGGLVIFLIGSMLAGASPSFWWLIGARVIQGAGMGTIMPLAQTIIGDILSPRERGKYMGYMGGVFGIASISGPLLGGYITDHFSWRWLFYVNLPIGIVALIVILSFLHLPHTPARHKIDYLGFATLGTGIVAALLATSWGGTTYPWSSWEIIGLYALAAVLLTAFVVNEKYAAEPVIPLGLWKNSIFTLSNISNLAISMGMFGAIYYIPVFAQGVLGVSVSRSGLLTISLTAAMIGTSIVVGRLITRTGRYKAIALAGTLVMTLGYLLLTRLGYGSTQGEVVFYLVVVGLGLGSVLQTYTLIVQNSVQRSVLGVATATTQFTRSVGATIGIAIFGTIMTSNLQSEIPKHLPQGAGSQAASQFSGGSGAGAVLNPKALAGLPEAVATGIREGLAAALHPVFWAGVPIVALAFFLTLFIKELPLKTVAPMDEARRKETEEAGPVEENNGKKSSVARNEEDFVLTSLALSQLAHEIESANGDAPDLISAASSLVPDSEGSERDRANAAAKHVIRPMASRMLLLAARGNV